MAQREMHAKNSKASVGHVSSSCGVSRRFLSRPHRLRFTKRAVAMSTNFREASDERLAAVSGFRQDSRRVLSRQQARQVYDENGKK
eukprot:scaffold653865_cov57-Prasinocladus_malaysianus.AAC.1